MGIKLHCIEHLPKSYEQNTSGEYILKRFLKQIVRIKPLFSVKITKISSDAMSKFLSLVLVAVICLIKQIMKGRSDWLIDWAGRRKGKHVASGKTLLQNYAELPQRNYLVQIK